MSISDRFMQQVFHIFRFWVRNPYMDFFAFLSIYALHKTHFVLYFYQAIYTETGAKEMALNIHKILANTLLDLCREKKLEAITIKDILEETGISRQTFYNRFRDKNDLIQWTYENMVLSEFHKSGETGSYYENTVAYCKALEKYRFFMKQAYQLEGQNNLRDWIYDYATEYDYNWHCQQMGVDSMSDEFAYISRYHSIATINMEMEWICSKDKERMSPEEIARRITKIRRISMSDKFFGPYNTVYEFPDEASH